MVITDDSVRCEGCGVLLQTEDPSIPGYVPESALSRIPVICQRCFRIKHYNDMSSVTLDQDHFLRMLGSIAHEKALVVHIVDLFDFEGSLIGGLQRFVGHNPVLLAVNKLDLLPKGTNWNRIRNWAQKQAKDGGLKVADTILISARKKLGIEQLMESIAQHRHGQDIYVVGATNVGKSSLINRLIRDFSDLENELTVSQFPGTTLDLIHIPLDDGGQIIDTPGIVYPYRLTEVVPRQYVKALLPDKPLKPAVYQLNSEQALFFGALARFDFVRGERQPFVCYVSDGVKIHRTKLERADEVYAEHKGELLQPPSGEDVAALPEWTRHSIRIQPGVRNDVLISGLGWIAIPSGKGAELMIHAPKGIKVAVRPSLI